MSYGASSYGQTSYGEGLQDTEEPQAPAGTITFVEVTPTHELVDVEFAYANADADGFEYRVDGGAPVDLETSTTFQVTGLDPDTGYAEGYIQVRAYNAIGAGDWFDAPAFQTDVEPVPPQGTLTVESVAPKATNVTVVVAYDATDITGFQYRVDSGSPVGFSSTSFAVGGLTPETTYAEGFIEVRAVNTFGESDWVGVPTFDTTEPSESGAFALLLRRRRR